MRYLFSLLSLLSVLGLQSQTYNYYFGNLHSHSGYSDGNKDSISTGISKPAGSYNFAKASLHFDFLGISEHNHYTANNNPGMVRTSYGLGINEANAANQDGTFLCMYGMEWGTSSSTNGHVIVYGFNQLIGWEASVPGLVGPNYDIYVDKNDYYSLFRLIKNTPGTFCYLAHPSWNDFGYLVSNPYNAMYDSAIVGIPFRNGLAFSTSLTYDDYPASNFFQYYRKMLSIGYHIGIGYDHDNHNLTFGRNNAGRLAILAPSLTRANLYSAMQSMHFYATDDWNAKIDLKINNKIMGDSTSGLTPPTINVTFSDDDGEIADTLKLWAGVEGSNLYSTVHTSVSGNNTISFTDNGQAPGSNKYYFVEVIQPDGDRVISSPIWYRLSQFASVSELEKSFNIVAFPNPVNATLYVSTNLNEGFEIEITDVSGKIIYSEKSSLPQTKLSTADFSSGFYNLKITSGKVVKNQKLVIE